MDLKWNSSHAGSGVVRTFGGIIRGRIAADGLFLYENKKEE